MRVNRMITKTGDTVHVIMWNNLDTTDYMRERIAEKAGIIETGLIFMKTSSGTVLPPGPTLRTCGLRNDDTIVWGIGGQGNSPSYCKPIRMQYGSGLPRPAERLHGSCGSENPKAPPPRETMLLTMTMTMRH